jgi:hypothetical protein
MAMSQEHKDALAEGRKQSRAIKGYLEALQARKPGRPITKESLETRLSRVNAQLGSSSDPLKSVQLVQTKLELEGELARIGEGVDLAALEKDFVTHASAYSARKGISYTAWRQVGVPAATLKAAGIKERRVRR